MNMCLELQYAQTCGYLYIYKKYSEYIIEFDIFGFSSIMIFQCTWYDMDLMFAPFRSLSGFIDPV